MSDGAKTIKCLIWDLDETLWRGTLLEDGTVHLPDEATASRLLTDLTAAHAHVIAFGPATGRLEAAYLASDAAHREGAL